MFESMFAGVGMALPLPTRIVIGAVAASCTGYWWAVIGWRIGRGRFCFKRYYATPSGKLVIDRLLLKVPVLGDVLRKSAVSRFTRTLGTLISLGRQHPRRPRDHGQDRGQPRHSGRDHGSRAPASPAVTRSPRRCRSRRCSRRWSSRMIAVGEQTGGLDEMLSKIADFYDEEVDAAVGGLLVAARADHDRVPRRRRRRHGGGDVPADLRHDQRGAVRTGGKWERARASARARFFCDSFGLRLAFAVPCPADHSSLPWQVALSPSCWGMPNEPPGKPGVSCFCPWRRAGCARCEGP